MIDYSSYIGFNIPNFDTETFKDTRGSLRTKSLFYETITVDAIAAGWRPTYSIRESNKKTELPSAYRIFMSSVDEYEAALKIVGSLKHWRKLCECTWFMEGDKPRNFDGLIQWREDMRLRDASLAKRQLVASAKEGDASSSRKLLDISYKEGKEAVVGRPKKVKPKDTKQDDNQSRIEKLHASINHDK